MTFKKNWLSVLLWIPFALLTVAVYGYVIFQALSDIPATSNLFLKIGVLLLTLGAAIGIFIGVRKLSKKINIDNWLIWEALAFAVLFGLGIFFRCYTLYCAEANLNSFTEGAYFETAMVGKGEIPFIAHGAQYFYVRILHGVFYVFGNHFLAGLILQIVLQSAAAIIWYIAIRKLAGPVAGLLFLGGVMLMPQSIRLGVTYSPKMMYLFFSGIILLLVTSMLRREYLEKEFKWYVCLKAVLTGAGIVFLTYLDVSGLIFLLPVFALCFVSPQSGFEEDNKGAKILRIASQLGSVIVGVVLSAIILFAVDAWQSGSTLSQVFRVWITLFEFKGVSAIPDIFLYKPAVWMHIIILFIMLIGVLAFFENKEKERQLLWLFLLGGACVVQSGAFFAKGMSPDALLFFLILALAGAGLQALITPKEEYVAIPEPIVEAPVRKVVPKKTNVDGEMKQEVKVETEVKAKAEVETKAGVERQTEAERKPKTEEKPRFIENPLPLPKKHEKRTMNYGVAVPRYKMKYDIAVADDDDFEIQ